MKTGINTNILSDFEKCKGRLCVQLSNNKYVARNVPHRDICDLTLTMRVNINGGIDGFLLEDKLAFAIVDNTMLNEWGVTDVDSLFDLAIKNSRRLFPEIITSLYDILKKHSFRTLSKEIAFSKLVPIHVVTSSRGTGGAAAIFYPQVADLLCAEFNDDILILPSSIHEVLVLPLNACKLLGRSADDLKSLVKMVNLEEVAPEDQLSDNVYIYRKEEKKFDYFS